MPQCRNSSKVHQKNEKPIMPNSRHSSYFYMGHWNYSDSMTLFVFLLGIGTVPTVWHHLFFYWTLEMFRQCSILFQSLISKPIMPHCRNSSKVPYKNKYCHTVGTVPKSNRKIKKNNNAKLSL
jgi:hypothetical protein